MAYYEMMPAGLPAGLQAGMDSVLNKKFGTSTTYPAEDWPDTVNLLGPLPEKTASGAIVTFSDGADDVPLKSCEVALSASLDGYSEVDVVATGKNLFDKSSVENSTWIVVNDTTTESAVGFRTSGYIPVKANTRYYVSAKSSNRSAYYDQNKNGIAYFSFSGGASFTCLYDGYIRITINDNIDLNTFVVNEGNEAIQYESFGTTHTANLGRMIYGGTPDVVKGEGEEAYGKKVFDGTEGTGGTPSWTMISVTQGTMFRITVFDKATTSATNTLCSYYTPVAQAQRADGTVSGAGTNVDIIDNRFSSVDDFKAWLSENPVVLVYELATPTNFTFEPVEISSRLGNNTMWSDGDMSVVYRRDIDLALQSLSGSRALMMALPQLEAETEETEPEETIEETPEEMER